MEEYFLNASEITSILVIKQILNESPILYVFFPFQFCLMFIENSLTIIMLFELKV